MICGGLLLQFFYILNTNINLTTNVVTDWPVVRILVGIAVPSGFILLLSQLSQRISTIRKSPSYDQSRVGMLFPSALILIAATVIHFGITWINYSRAAINLSENDIIRNWLSDIVWPIGMLGLFLWIRSVPRDVGDKQTCL